MSEHEEWRRLQARLIKEYHPVFRSYPELRALSYSELAQRINIDGTYDQIQ